eukprot:3657576-Pyramimonas_sp.AAC.1
MSSTPSSASLGSSSSSSSDFSFSALGSCCFALGPAGAGTAAGATSCLSPENRLMPLEFLMSLNVAAC